LLSNALKFTPQNGNVHISARDINCRIRPGLRRGDPATLQVIQTIDRHNGNSSDTTRNGLEIVIKDSGIGLNPDHLSRIFNRFEQIDGSRGRNYSGTGLGLALTKALVELHGGSIEAESDGEGKGCTFRVIIPVGNE
jgi:signal transduction histidine kinase